MLCLYNQFHKQTDTCKQVEHHRQHHKGYLPQCNVHSQPVAMQEYLPRISVELHVVMNADQKEPI